MAGSSDGTSAQELLLRKVVDANTGRDRPRLRLACQRCQRRKIRCDGDLPACSNCRNAGTACTDGASARMRALPRAHITALQNRVSWLESIIRDRCPDIDLSQDAPITIPETAPSELSGNEFADHSSQQMSVDVVATNNHTTTAAPSQLPGQPASEARRREDDREIGGWATSAHQIGLIALGNGQDPRYIGPSSGYFLARVLLQASERANAGFTLTDHTGTGKSNTKLPFPCELVESMQGPLPMPSKEGARFLSQNFFDLIHMQFPILHQPTFMGMLDQMYTSTEPDPVVAFQVFMVLAIGASVCSRRSRPGILGDSYGITAMQYFDQINVQNSLQGLQCLLLMLIYAIHNPSVRFNIWYLNYQCIAALLDLGLQRSIDTSTGVSIYEQGMRTRLFWSVYTLDRTIATIMGRPIGLRDEACELRWPQNISDAALSASSPPVSSQESPHMHFAIHLFKLAKINSEIKYVANSINRAAPEYALPAITDINAWQKGVLQQLDSWADEIPTAESDKAYARSLCQIQYHSIRVLLTRPSPAIPKPSADILTQCCDSAVQTIRLYDQLYKQDLLVASWTILHSVTMSAISMMYCTRMVPSIEQRTALDILMHDVAICQNLLSAIGEHWSVAKRCRDIVDDLGRSTIRWLKKKQATPQVQSTPGGTADQASVLEGPHTVSSSVEHPITPNSFDIPLMEMQNSIPGVQLLDAQDPLHSFSAYLGDNLFGELADSQFLMGYAFEDFV